VEGWWFLLLIFGVLMASLNTGNNLLYLLLAMLLFLLVLQNVLGEWHFRGLRLERRLPAEAFANEGAPGILSVANHRRGLSAYSLVLEELGGQANCTVSSVPPGQRVDVPLSYQFKERGLNQLEGVVISSSFPFGLFRRIRTVVLEAEMLVYPERRPGAVLARPMETGDEAPDLTRRGGSEEFLGLRPYEVGDTLRRIHWRTSAKQGSPVIVELSQAQSEAVLVQIPTGGDIEAGLARACGQAERHFQRGHAVGLRAPGVELRPDRGDAHRRRLLSSLALFGREA
jgi:uncharacterized protein (DUF58 family)